MTIEDFPLAWRWTKSSHSVLPPEVLAQIHPLSPQEAARLRVSADASAQGALVVSRFIDELIDVRDWLRSIQPDGQASVYVTWSQALAVRTTWGIFTRYWDDFCYPSSDDVTVAPVAGTWRLVYCHDERFRFIPASQGPPGNPPPKQTVRPIPPWSKLLEKLRKPTELPSSPPYWTSNIALREGVTYDALVDFVIDGIRRKVPQQTLCRDLEREFGLKPLECELVWDRVHGGVSRAATGRWENRPDRETDTIAWTSYEKARINPAIISELYPPRPERAMVAWTCPDCGEQLEAQFHSCWNCGANRPERSSAPPSPASMPTPGEANPWHERAQMPLSLPMTVVAFFLPLIILAGWFCAAGLQHSYKTKGFARKRKEFHRWLLVGVLFWCGLCLSSLVWWLLS
ncbi:MAG: hypothetical protein NT154_14705 [Verrucomicrobia bacterium]|nr:hypothetical protein [Verrucomicrobiota bacterium]